MTKNDDNNGKTPQPRNTKSWKTEAAKLKALLVQACWCITNTPVAEDGERQHSIVSFERDVELSTWWADHQVSSKSRTAELKAAALAKLSDDERAALGLG